MAIQVQIRRGTTAQNNDFTGAVGELTVDTTKDTVVVHDGSTAGGFPLAKESGSAISATNLSYTGTLTGGTGVINIGSGQLYKDASGNVGIGTSSPAQKLTLQGDAAGNANSVRFSITDSAGTEQFFFGSRTTTNTDLDIGVTASANLKLRTNDTERMRITSAGNVCIGTSSPAANARLTLQSSNTARFSITDGTTTSNIFTDFGGFYLTTETSSPMIFITNAAERMRITSAGNVLIGKTTATANGGDLQVSSGITFPATQVPSSNANTLDDYEEGTWTPNLIGTSTAGTGTYSTQFGRYTKIGRVVYYEINIICTAHTGTGNVRITMPFTSASGTHGGAGSGFTVNINFASGTAHAAQMSGNSVNLGIFTYGDNIAAVNITNFVGAWVYSGFYVV
jgi:hypothetical protein